MTGLEMKTLEMVGSHPTANIILQTCYKQQVKVKIEKRSKTTTSKFKLILRRYQLVFSFTTNKKKSQQPYYFPCKRDQSSSAVVFINNNISNEKVLCIQLWCSYCRLFQCFVQFCLESKYLAFLVQILLAFMKTQKKELVILSIAHQQTSKVL